MVPQIHRRGVALVYGGEGVDTERGKLAHVRQGRIAQSLARCPADGAGYVGDAIVHDAIYYLSRLVMCGRPACLDAAALIDADVDDDAAGFHLLQQRPVDQHRRPPAGDQHRSDYEVR